MIKLSLNENFVCRIWENKSYYIKLLTTEKVPVEVIDYGIRNTDAGPDYKNAKVKIGNILYSGSIEIHCSLNDWYMHHHTRDDKYNDVILQVVFYRSINREDILPLVKRARHIPTVILSDFLSISIHSIWRDIINNPSPNFRLPCYPKNSRVSHALKIQWLNILSVERLRYRSERIRNRLLELSDQVSKKIFWEQVLFEFICEALGYSKNKDQFLKLSQKIEIVTLKQMAPGRLQLDSLLFGLGGFLKNIRYKDEYIVDLKDQWDNLKDIFKRESMDKSEWNFFRLRPANFPTLRIAYASSILYEIIYRDFFKKIILTFESSNEIDTDLIKLFKETEVAIYWKNHYVFGKESKSEVNAIGAERINNIVVNVLLPMVYLYSVYFENMNLRNRIEFYYKKVNYKDAGNEITRVMEKQLDLNINFLADEQALIHLHNFFCVKGKCKECDIGKIVFEKERDVEPLKIILY